MEIEKEKIYADVLKVIDSLGGREFEYFCAKLLENSGYRDVIVTPSSGDFGIDITARYHNRIYGIQCKRYVSKVGIKAVQEAYSGAEYYGCDIAVVLSSGIFTKEAIKTGERIGVRLWDRNDLVNIISKCEDLSFVDDFKKEVCIKNEITKNVNKNEVVKKTNQKNIKIKKQKQNNSTQPGCLAYFLTFILVVVIITKGINIITPRNEIEESESDVIFEWSNLFEEGHPYFSCDSEIADKWKDKYRHQVDLDGNFYDYEDSMVMELKNGVGKEEGMIVDIVICYDKIENYNSGDEIKLIREYMPLDKMEMYYEFDESYALADEDSPDDEKYYLANWEIKDEYLELYSADKFDGTYQITLEINRESRHIRINSKGIPNWASPSRMDFNGLVKKEWDIQSLIMY